VSPKPNNQWVVSHEEFVGDTDHQAKMTGPRSDFRTWNFSMYCHWEFHALKAVPF